MDDVLISNCEFLTKGTPRNVGQISDILFVVISATRPPQISSADPGLAGLDHAATIRGAHPQAS